MSKRQSGARFAMPMLLLVAVSFGSGIAHAANNLDQCNDVLRQDLFNRTSGSSTSTDSEHAAFLNAFF